MKKYDEVLGSPYSCGKSDAYYRVARSPRYMKKTETHNFWVEAKNMTPEEIEEYNIGYDSIKKRARMKAN